MEGRPYQPDRRSRAMTRYYLTDAGTAYIAPIAAQRTAGIVARERERLAKEQIEATAPRLLSALKALVADASEDSMEEAREAIAQAETIPDDDKR